MNKGNKIIGVVTMLALATVLALTYVGAPSGAEETEAAVTTEEVIVTEGVFIGDETVLPPAEVTICHQNYYDSWYLQLCLVKGELNTLKSPTQVVVKVWHQSMGEPSPSWKSIAACWLSGNSNTVLDYSRDTKTNVPVGLTIQSAHPNYLNVSDVFPGWQSVEMKRVSDNETLGFCLAMPGWMPPMGLISKSYSTQMIYIQNQAWFNAGGMSNVIFR